MHYLGTSAEGAYVPTTSSHRAASRSRGRHPRRSPLRATQTPVLEVAGVTARAPGGRILLDDVSFTVERGWLVAIVGPTGAGKTSLARALTGSLALRAGTIRVDGADLSEPGSHGLDRVAFVPQDDVLHGQLALGRTLAYAASLRVPPGAGPDERVRRVDAALTELGLQHHVTVPVSSLSGGQRKRANIAAELVGEPDVLVLDEPTSGLDPGYEKAVMTSLRELADAGRTVVTVTHSMQALEQCDRVLFLAEGGRVAYFGPPARAAAYFGRGDAADVFLALDTEPGQAWQERFRAHPAYARYVSPVVAAAARTTERRAPRDRPSWSAQLGMLVRRQIALLRSDRRHLALLTLQGPVLGALLWFVIHPNSLGVIPHSDIPSPAAETVALFVALSATWLGASNAVREVVKERHILRREVDAGLAPSAYVASKAIVLGAVTMMQTTVLTLIACAGQHPPASGALIGSSRLELAVVGALVGLAATTLGLALSAVATAADRALALLPMTLVTELVLAGRWASHLTTPGLNVLRDLTGARWGVAAIGATVAGDGGTWFRAVAVLVLLTSGFFALAVGMVHHHTRSALGRVSPFQRIGALQTAAMQRGSAVLGVATLGLFAAAVSIVVGGTGHDPARLDGPAVAAPVVASVAEVAEAPVTTAPPVTTPTTTVATPTTLALQAIKALRTPPTTAPAPTTTTTAAPTTTTTVPTTTTTTSTTSTTAPASGGKVTTASNSSPAWWSPWFWMGF
jgi:ABC-type multidrug transport system ATPase subunit